MTAQRVLLVEDHSAFNGQLRDGFERAEITHVRSVAELRALEAADWDVAFIDFQLGDGDLTGLSAYLHVKQVSPRTRCVTLTALGESGRTLFAVAARRWFGAWATLDKRILDAERIREIATGANPTPELWTENLRHHGYLIDLMFAEPAWVQFWRRWLEAGGTHRGMAMLIPGSAQACLDFARANVGNIHNLSDAFLGTTGTARSSKPQVVISTFVEKHHLFFQAPDLVAAVDAAQPWRRSSTQL